MTSRMAASLTGFFDPTLMRMRMSVRPDIGFRSKSDDLKARVHILPHGRMPVHVPDQGNARLFRMRRRAQLGRTGPAEAIEESGLTDLDKKPMQRMPGLHQRFRQADRSAFYDHPLFDKPHENPPTARLD